MIDASSKIEVVLGDYKKSTTTLIGTVGYWRLNEVAGSVAFDSSNNGLHGNYIQTAGFAYGVPGLLEGSNDTAAMRTNASALFTVGHNALLNLPNTFTLEAWTKLTTEPTAYGQILISKGTPGAANSSFQLYIFGSASGLTRQVGLWGSVGGVWTQLTGMYTLSLNQKYHIVAVYDSVAGAGLYINGVLWATGSPVGAVGTNSDTMSINVHDNQYVDEVAIYNFAATPQQILAHYRAGTWNDITNDVLAGSIRLKYGVYNDGPTDCVAGTGDLQFQLRNDEGNSGAMVGYYSPASGSKRVGWDFGIPVRASFTSGAHTDKVRFLGKIRSIHPVSGKWRKRTVDVVAYDIIRDLAETDARQVTLQLAKTETQLLTTLVSILPNESRPRATNFDAGVDTYPIAFDNLGGNAKALAVGADIVVSSIGLLCSNGDGTLRYRSRSNLSTGPSLLLIDRFAEVSVPSSLDKVYNRVRVTTHPKTVSPAANEVLYTLPSSATNPIQLAPLQVITLWTNYSDPNDRQTDVGGTNVVGSPGNGALVAGTHYNANSQADGSGITLNANITVTIDAFSSTAKWTITNISASTSCYLIGLQVVGKAVRDPGPQTFESVAAFSLADRPANLDLPYQNDPHVGQSVADYTVLLYSKLPQQVNSVQFLANLSEDLMTAALTFEPGDRVTISEEVTAVSAVVCHIRSIELRVQQNNLITCVFGLKPASTIGVWTLGVVDFSELGVSTTLGI